MSQPKLDLGLKNAIASIKHICKESQGRSQFFPYGGSGYKASVTHYFESSTEVAGGAVQPGSGEDLAKIFKAIADTGVKFAVKCGGHSTNPEFSSTTGIQIYLSRLNEIEIDTTSTPKLVRVGAGCLFEELYQALDACDPKLNIVGGSGLSGVGLSGWMLGGGYSPKTSQYGLGVDNLESAKIALPNGTIKVASAKENKDLFFAIKGGLNNFGIVTEFTLIAHEQGEYYDHTFTFKDAQYFELVKEAIYGILKVGDNRANVEAAFRHYAQPSTAEPLVTLTVHCVYDGPYPTPDPFGELKKIPEGDFDAATAGALSLPGQFQTNSFLVANLFRSIHNGTFDLLSRAPTAVISDIPETVRPTPPMAGIGRFPRFVALNMLVCRELNDENTLASGRWGNVMVDEFTPGIVDEIQKQAAVVAKELGQHGGTRITIGFWPFTKSMFDNATRSALPHEKGKPNCPIIVYFTWENQKNDDHWITTMKSTLETLRKKVLEERPSSEGLPYMINTALYEATEVKDLYRDNLPELQRIRAECDPTDVMRHTGGFRIPLLPQNGKH